MPNFQERIRLNRRNDMQWLNSMINPKQADALHYLLRTRKVEGILERKADGQKFDSFYVEKLVE